MRLKLAKPERKNSKETIEKLKKEIKKEQLAIDAAKKYDKDIDIVDSIKIDFQDDIDSSAKTVNGDITLNSILLEEDFVEIMKYFIHEFVHSLQHKTKKNLQSTNRSKDDYLDNSAELEAFQTQIGYEAKKKGDDKAEDYAEDLVEYHELEGEEAEDKKEELLEEVK